DGPPLGTVTSQSSDNSRSRREHRHPACPCRCDSTRSAPCSSECGESSAAQPLHLRAADSPGALASSETAKALEPQGKTKTGLTLSPTPPAFVFVKWAPPPPSDPLFTVRLELSVKAKEKPPAGNPPLPAADVPADLLIPAEVLATAQKEADKR